MGRLNQVLSLVSIVAVVAAALLGYGAVKADARADAARAAWEASDSTFRAFRDSVRAVRAARDDSLRAAQQAADSFRRRADSLARARAPTTQIVERLIPTLPDSVRVAIEAERRSLRLEIVDLRLANDSLQSVIWLGARQRHGLELELHRVNLRLTEALRGWDAAERARRPGVVNYATRALALVGAVLLVERLSR